MRTYILTWNPQLWDWEDFAGDVKAVQSGRRSSVTDWSCGRTRSISRGDHFYFLRQGASHPGVIGSGTITGPPLEGDHWDGSGRLALYVKIRFDTLVNPLVDPYLSKAELPTNPTVKFDWTIRESGRFLPDALVPALDRGWQERVGKIGRPEGKKRYWLFNIMHDRFPDHWKRMVETGVAAQHYNPGFASEVKNIKRLSLVQPGDHLLAAFGGYRFAGFGTALSALYRSGKPLNLRHTDGDVYEFLERFDCEWHALKLAPRPDLVDCRDLVDEGHQLRLEHGYCIRETSAKAYLAVERRLKERGVSAPPVRKGHQQAVDLAEPPRSVKSITLRKIRDTASSIDLKRRYDYQCQVCGEVLLGPDSARYAEVHHLRPLGGHHRGLDRQDNMLVLCPNHHALFDLGTPFFLSLRRIRVGSTTFPLEVRHGLNRSNVDYHNALHKGAS